MSVFNGSTGGSAVQAKLEEAARAREALARARFERKMARRRSTLVGRVELLEGQLRAQGIEFDNRLAVLESVVAALTSSRDCNCCACRERAADSPWDPPF